MKLHIINSHHQEYHQIEWLEARTSQGSIVIQLGHAPLIATLIAPSQLTFLLTTGETKVIEINRPGFLEVDRSSVTALIH